MWDERYRSSGWSSDPDEALVALAASLPPGRALDLGCGTGRNSLWLAQHGWEVSGVDASAVGLARGVSLANSAGLALQVEQADLVTYVGAPGHYELVVIANIHLAPHERDAFFANAANAVAPGGHLYITGHHVDALGQAGPPDVERLFTESMFDGRFRDFTVEILERRESAADEDQRPDVVVLLWATKRPAGSGERQ